MKNFCHILWFGLILLVRSGFATNEDAEIDEGELSRVKRGGWSMLRLGRGLQMLRLGKRQPPLPRYGKDLDWQTALENSLTEDNEDAGQPERRSDALYSEVAFPHVRPAPRGGKYRFRRSLDVARLAKLAEKYGLSNEQKERAVALPRIGRLTKERAVPAPRIGRENLQ